MEKKHIVRLIDAEREQLNQMITKLSGSSLKARCTPMFLKADADGLN